MNLSRNIKLIIQFDGTDYSGWLYQNGRKTLQGTVMQSIYMLTGNEVEVIGCSRTDKGVHAVGYVLNFIDNSNIPIEKYPIALNSFLPEDICVKSACEVPMDFHATYLTSKKTYRYYFYTAPSKVPMLNNRAWYIGNGCNYSCEILDTLNKNLYVLCGKHDFSAFRAMGGMSKTTVRTIYNIHVACDDYYSTKMYYLEITGNGFLYNMVRIIAGTIADVMRGRIQVDSIDKILKSCDRNKAGQTAPAGGLYLWKVDYSSSQY